MRKLIKKQLTKKEVKIGLIEEFVNNLVGKSYKFDRQFIISHIIKEVIDVSFLKTNNEKIDVFVLVEIEKIK